MSSLSSLQTSSRRRIFLILFAVIIFVTLLSTFLHGQYRQFPQLQQLVNPDLPISIPYRANATFVMLCRNEELQGVLSSIRQIEDRFNRDHDYPWVLLNDKPFDEEFKRRVSVITKAPVHFGFIPPEIWNQPDSIDEERAAAGRAKLKAEGIIYAESVPYRNMCRFNSGFFYRHELLKPYRYYWRVEPNVDYFCNLNYDPFEFMERNNKTYGFTISLLEWHQTIPTLWDSVKEFIEANPQFVHPNNAMNFVSNNGGKTYNQCHFWSNFEIADMDFWRGEAYSKFFDFLEEKGGFYYERWGDAPVHSIAVSLFAPKDSIHYFYDIGYRHDSFQHCPSGNTWREGSCSCDPTETFNNRASSCTEKFMVAVR
ncbi:alpha-1,2 mannosyltransferase KTR1 [Coprinopsis cinerea AmutBmut pab1-1]|nr:alpha-1,2 mannosyltransferase KTR1 [Coprinopsis cinerea AmutBmut pab1-1]